MHSANSLTFLFISVCSKNKLWPTWSAPSKNVAFSKTPGCVSRQQVGHVNLKAVLMLGSQLLSTVAKEQTQQTVLLKPGFSVPGLKKRTFSCLRAVAAGTVFTSVCPDTFILGTSQGNFFVGIKLRLKYEFIWFCWSKVKVVWPRFCSVLVDLSRTPAGNFNKYGTKGQSDS